MARKRNQIVNRITVDIMDLAARFLGMNDDEIGAWMRKAVSDWNNGCTADDADPLVKECYEKSLEAMQKRQDINAQNYLAHHRKIKDLSSCKPNTISTTRNQLAGEITPESQDKTSLPVSLAGNAPASTSGVKKPYGTCGHVMLTDEEGHHLREVYGENLRIAIDILDAYIENNGKAAKRYKNHAAVMRKGNWVWRNVQEMKRLENSANRSGKSFKQQDRDHQSELLHTSLFAPSIGNKRIANG